MLRDYDPDDVEVVEFKVADFIVKCSVSVGGLRIDESRALSMLDE
jgi:hypothetical protein